MKLGKNAVISEVTSLPGLTELKAAIKKTVYVKPKVAVQTANMSEKAICQLQR